MDASDFLTTGEQAALISAQFGIFVPTWRVARLFEMNLLPDPGRIAGRRAIPRSMTPQIVAVMRTRGWLPAAEPANA